MYNNARPFITLHRKENKSCLIFLILWLSLSLPSFLPDFILGKRKTRLVGKKANAIRTLARCYFEHRRHYYDGGLIHQSDHNHYKGGVFS